MVDQGERGDTGPRGEIGEVGPPGEDSPSNTKRLLVIFVFVVIAFLVLAAGYQRLDSIASDNAAQNARDACLADVLTKSVEAQEETAGLTGQVIEAARKQAAELLAFLDSLDVSPPIPEEGRRRLFNEWRTATRDYLQLSNELAQLRRQHPVPTVEQIEACSG